MRRVLLVLLAAATGLLAALVPAPARPAEGVGAQLAAASAPAPAEPQPPATAAEADVQAPPGVPTPASSGLPATTAQEDADTQLPSAPPTAPSSKLAGSEPASFERPPACTYADLPAPRSGFDQWRETVLDTVFALPADYEPPDLVPVAGAFPPGQPGGGELRVRAVMLDDLAAMLAAAAEQGLAFAVQSAYRSYTYQAGTFQYWVERNGEAAALATSARPGHSEHQLGTAIDLRSLGGPPAWDLEDWAETPEGAWATANAWRFGFVMSYPRGGAGVTCYSYEPWHFRYLGVELAAEVQRLGVTPRELLWARTAAERID